MRRKPREAAEIRRRARAGKLFLLPFMIGFVCFYVQPLLLSLFYTFINVQPTKGGGLTLGVGDTFIDKLNLDNYKYMFEQENDYWQSLIATFKDMAITTPVIIIFSLFIALILNQKFRGRVIARAIFFMPVVVTSGLVMSFITGDAFADQTQTTETSAIFQAAGMSDILQGMNLPEDIVSIFTSITSQIFDTLWLCGVQILLFLAALQGVSPQLYEAAKIEGATGWEIFWKVTFPSVTPIILVNIIYTIIDKITDSSNGLMGIINGTGFGAFQYSRACLMAWIFFILLLVLVGLVFLFTRKMIFYQTDN
ncbi:MAG: sugar ABC transporter permease [Clostridia bacterium]|nr:sugar ABC transporter permease [Clostridia bacterium]